MDNPYQKDVTESCGCVFCDLGLEPDLVDGEWVHEVYGSKPCTKTTDAPVAQEVEAGS